MKTDDPAYCTRCGGECQIPGPIVKEEPMFTIIDTHTNEAVTEHADPLVGPESDDPVLFDTEAEAADYAVAQGLDGQRFAIVATDEILPGGES